MEVLSWLIRSVPLALAAALAQMLAPLALSLRAILSSSSTPVLAWTAVPAQIPAPTALSLPLNNQNSNIKNTGHFVRCFFLQKEVVQCILSMPVTVLHAVPVNRFVPWVPPARMAVPM